MYVTSKITSNYQATIPLKIRRLLNIHKGDAVEFDIQDNQVILKKISSTDFDYIKAIQPTLNEWKSKEDDTLFKKL